MGKASNNRSNPPDAKRLLAAGIAVFYGNTVYTVHSQSENADYTLIQDKNHLFQVPTKLLTVVKPCG